MKHRTLTLALLLIAASAAFVCPRLAPPAEGAAVEPQQRRRQGGSRQRRRAPARPRTDYTKFSHTTPAHRRDSCDSCHKSPSDNWARVRARESAFPDITDYPEHASCLNCHRAQFFNGARPAICSVCHTVVSPRADGRHPFQNPSEPFARSGKAKTARREFALVFPHDLHQDVMADLGRPAEEFAGVRFVRAGLAQEAAQKAKPNSCSVCHETHRRQPASPATEQGAQGAAGAAGTAAAAGAASAAQAGATLPDGLLKTTPTGHASCFNCHWQDGGERPFSSDCAGCHKLMPAALATTPPPAGRDADAQLAARAGFTDPGLVRKLLRRESVTFAHDEENHRGIDCASCHTRIPSISTLDDSTLKVPILSCGGGSGCHISARPKKILNEEVDKRVADATFQCTKCHVNLGRAQTPRSHLDAVGK